MFRLHRLPYKIIFEVWDFFQLLSFFYVFAVWIPMIAAVVYHFFEESDLLEMEMVDDTANR